LFPINNAFVMPQQRNRYSSTINPYIKLILKYCT
jgi:hypothetical protein